MQLFYGKRLHTVLIFALLAVALIMPETSYGYYSGKHYRSYGHYGHRYSGHSRRYGYKRYGGHGYFSNNHYRGSYSAYPRQKYYKQYRRSYSFIVPANISVYAGNREYRQATKNYSENEQAAWQSLAEGQYSVALNIFANQAQSNPKSGAPKVGYALSMAALGDLHRGIWAMNRALSIDPDSLHYLQLNETNSRLLNELIDQYTSQKNEGLAEQDFMVSALQYLKHDYLAANQSIISAQAYEDTNSSVNNLQKLIAQQLGIGKKY